METSSLYFKTGDFLLPRQDVNLTAWACVACDQFTSQPEYWEQVSQLVGNLPSTYKLVVPECYLDEAAQRIPKAHAEMRSYLDNGIVQSAVKDGFILTERSTGSGARVGLVALIDLEGYDYHTGSRSFIRPTEGTILERLPPRMQIRRGASLEMSHVLLLISDPMASVVEPLYQKRSKLQKLYDFPLMMEGGHVTGYAVTSPQDIAAVQEALLALQAQLTGQDPFLFAVGDGNHSLAAAKACWDEIKPTLPPAAQENHPARFALVEMENIHDDALLFEPIHRVVTGYDGDVFMDEWAAYAVQHGMSLAGGTGAQEMVCIFEGKQVNVGVTGSAQPLAVGTLQAFLDEWLPSHPGVSLDYVHGEEAVRKLAAAPDTIGFLLPAPNKQDLFSSVQRMGALPRKTFSMGEAHEKRYYLETRRLG